MLWEGDFVVMYVDTIDVDIPDGVEMPLFGFTRQPSI